MGSFMEYHNKKNNTTATTKTSSSSSFMEYHNKRQKEREEEEERRKAEKEKQMSTNTIKATNTANVLPRANSNFSNLEDFQKEYDKLSITEQAELAKQISNKSNLEVLAENNKLSNAPLYSAETLSEDSQILKNHSNDIAAIGSNVWQGTKKGIMNFIETGVSAMNNRWYDDDKFRQELHQYGNELREQAGKETVEYKSTEEIYKELLGESYNKNIFGKDVEREKEKWDKTKNIIDTQIVLNTANTDSPASRKLAEIAPSIGQQLPGYIMPGGTSLVYFTGSAKGSYKEEALQRGMTEEEAETYSGIMALTEGLTEQVGTNLTKNVGKSVLKGNTEDTLKAFGLDVVENFVEEAVMEPLSETTATLTGGKETANWDNMGERMLNSGIDGALTSIIMAGGSAGLGKTTQLINKLNNNQQVTIEEISEAVKETLQSDKVDQEQLKEAIKENTNNIISQNAQTLQKQDIMQENIAEKASNEGSFTRKQEILNNKQSQKDISIESIDKISSLLGEGGYRTQEQINTLMEDIRENGIKKPIELIKNSNGEIVINDGNHRLAIAKELGLKEVPVTYLHEDIKNIKDIEKYNKELYNESKDIIKGEYNNDINETSKRLDSYIERSGNIGRSGNTNNISDENTGTTGENDTIYSGEQKNNNRPSSDSTRIENSQWKKINNENSNKSSFSIQPNVAPSIDNNVASVAENSKQNNDLKKKYTRKEVRNRLFNEMQISPEDLNIGDDIKSPNYQITDPVRVNEKVFGKELGDKINNATINKTKHNTAEKIRWQNKERQDIKDLGIKARSKESSAVQKYGEKQWVDNNGNIHKYGDAELAKEFPNIETQNKIKKAAQVIREKYDSYIEQINEVLTELGYDAIPKRTDYMRHFHELGDIFSKTGVPFNLNDMSVEDLPTDINGLTEFNKPGKNWFASSQKRYGNKTTYDAITGIDGYLEGAGNLIFHTEDIQNYRALSEAIRNQFGQTKGFDNLEGLTDEQKQQRIKDIQSNKLSKYVAWLDEQANSLAGKKGSIDRGFERVLGRKGYTLLNTVKKQVGSNMTGFNVRSSLTNFISSTIAAAKTNKIALAKGTVSTINNMFHNDGFVEKSDFLTSRFGSDSLSAKTWQKISNAGQIFMTGSDYFTSNLIARSKYFEGLQKGMSEQEALNYSNDFSSKVMGDRSQGAMPEAFNSKTLGLFTQFQLEVNNQWQYMIHDTKMDYQQNVKDKGGLKAGATVLFQMGQLAAYSYFFNELFEKLTGSRAAFDPIEIFKTLFGLDEEDEEKTFDQRIAEAGEMLADNILFGNLITGGGRIPISDAFEGIGTLGKKITNQKNQYGGEITWGDVGKDMLNSLPYWVSPTGYSQANKTVQGLSTVINSGDYKTNSKGEKELRFPVENKNAGTYIKAGLFGKYSLPTAQDYIKRDFKKLSANQTKTYEESGLTYKQYINYADADLKNKEEKIDYINKQEWTYKQKWNIYKNDILSSTKRKDGSSQLSDAEYIVSHGVSKTKFMELYNKAYKNGIDMPTQQEYKEMQKKGITLERYIYDKIYKR